MLTLKDIGISQTKKTYVISEVGINHGGSIEKAKLLIESASKTGCDAVKFQTFDLDNMLLRETKLANYQKKTKFLNQYKMLKKFSLTKEEF